MKFFLLVLKSEAQLMRTVDQVGARDVCFGISRISLFDYILRTAQKCMPGESFRSFSNIFTFHGVRLTDSYKQTGAVAHLKPCVVLHFLAIIKKIVFDLALSLAVIHVKLNISNQRRFGILGCLESNDDYSSSK